MKVKTKKRDVKKMKKYQKGNLNCEARIKKGRLMFNNIEKEKKSKEN